jgi:plastocyanin
LDAEVLNRFRTIASSRVRLTPWTMASKAWMVIEVVDLSLGSWRMPDCSCNGCHSGHSAWRNGSSRTKHKAALARILFALNKTSDMKHSITLLALLTGATISAQTTHELHVMDNQFNPSALTIGLGDMIHIIFDDEDHTFTQVDQATWLSNGTTPLTGGFNLGQGTPQPGTDFTITPMALGTIYYVCQIHVDMGMKGSIAVVSTGIEEASMQNAFELAPNPSFAYVKLITDQTAPMLLDVFDAAGQRSMGTRVSGHSTIDVTGLAPGSYAVHIRNMEGALLSRQRLVVIR